MKKTDRVCLLIDIETSVNTGTFYGKLYETSIVEVLEHSHLTGFAVKEIGKDKVWVYDLEDFPLYKRKPKSDKALLKKLTEWIEKADVIIAHNGDGFDIPTVNARLDYHRLPLLPPEKTIDTLKIARKLWRLPSYKLDFLCQYFGLGRKLERGKGKMKRREERIYNSYDVVLLDRLYKLILPHIGHHPALRERKVRDYSLNGSCVHCGSKKTQSRGKKLIEGKIRSYFQCQECFRWFPKL